MVYNFMFQLPKKSWKQQSLSNILITQAKGQLYEIIIFIDFEIIQMKHSLCQMITAFRLERTHI